MKAERMMNRLGIAYTRLTDEQIIEHKQKWVHQMLPPELWQKAIECYCLPADDGCSDYLWHAFSFDLIKGLYGDEARNALQGIQANEAILLSNWEDAGYHLLDASLIKPQDLEEVSDVVLTSTDFTWTYAKTHEAELGPYFFKI